MPMRKNFQQIVFSRVHIYTLFNRHEAVTCYIYDDIADKVDPRRFYLLNSTFFPTV